MSTILQVRNDTTTNWTAINPILAIGEFGYDSTLKQHKIGDGITPWNTLAWDTAGAKGDTGAAGNGGQVVINFGSGMGSNETSLFVSIPTILVTSLPTATIAAVPTVDHTEPDHSYAASFISLSCDTPIAGVGFTIYARCILGSLSGTFTVNYSWI